jgi:hypothetical protein
MDSTAKSMSRSGHRRWCGLGLSTNMISRILASWNQGNSLNGTKSSRSSTSNQNPSGPRLLTSTAEMALPRRADFIFVFPHQPEHRRQSTTAEAIILRQGDRGFQPELRLPVSVLNMYVRPRLFAGKEIEPIPTGPEDCRTHGRRIPPPSPEGKQTRFFFPPVLQPSPGSPCASVRARLTPAVRNRAASWARPSRLGTTESGARVFSR